jgi:hypothetical protein
MRAAFLFVALVGTLGCAKSLATPPAPGARAEASASRPKGLRAGALVGVPGENVEYRITLRGFTIGNVVVAVGQVGDVDGHRAVVVRSRGTGSGAFALFSELSWELKTVLALDLGTALSEEETVDVELVVGQKEHEHHERDLTNESSYNLHAAAGLLRGWKSKIGESGSVDVRISDMFVNVELTDTARERIGDLPAVRYDGVAREKYKLSIWISDDEARVPLKMVSQSKFGEIVVDMVSYDVSRDLLVNR